MSNVLLKYIFLFLEKHGDSCKADTAPGTCKPLSHCIAVFAEIKKAGSPMPPDLSKKIETLTCGFDGTELMVCCALSSTSYKDTSNNSTVLVPEDIQNHPNLHLLPEQCGAMAGDRIMGGTRTNLFQFPWMVLLSYYSDRIGVALGCGGTLISERYVLTAAHCLLGLGRIRLTSVVIGEYDVRTNPDCAIIKGKKICAPKIKNTTVEEAIHHPGFSFHTGANDIALIRLAEPADFSLKSVKPICLPRTRALQTESLVGDFGLVAGWGATENGLLSPVLMSVSLPIISTEECNTMFHGRRNITAKQICAGGQKGKDTCRGDSGGPLMYQAMLGHNVKYVQWGIVSFGYKTCGSAIYPGVFTNVAYYMDWILDHMRD